MSDDKLRDSLEDLFSDAPFPEMEGERGTLPPTPESTGEPHPEPAEELLAPFAPPDVTELSPPAPAGPAPAGPDPLEEGREHATKKGGVTQGLGSPLEDLQTWRRGLVQRIFRDFARFGVLILAIGCYAAYASGEMWLIPVYLAAFALIALGHLWRRAPYALQALVLLGLIYGLGVLDLVEDGIGGSGRVFLVLLPFSAILFFGLREGAVALGLILLTMTGFSWAFATGRIIVPVETQVVSANPIAWLSGTFVLLMMAALPLVSLGYVLPRLVATLAQSRKLSDALEAERDRLEDQVTGRTRALQEANYALKRRAIQLEASAEVGRVITSIVDVDQLLRRTMELIRDKFGFYHVGIFLLDEAGEWAILQAATGEAGAQMLAQGHRLAVGETSMVGWTALHRQPRIELDVGQDDQRQDGLAPRFANPLLPYTRSEITLPLMISDRLLGVLNVQSAEAAAFDDEDVRVLQSMADQVAVAIENAQRFSDETLLLEATSPIYRASRRLAQATTIGEVADSIIASVTETGADGCTVVEFEFSSPSVLPREPEALIYRGVWRRNREPEYQPGMRLSIAESPFPFHIVSTLWTVADVEQDAHLPERARQVFEDTGARALVNIPLRARERVIGQVVVLRDTPGPFPDSALRLYEALSNQAAVALERGQLLEEAQRRAEQEQQTRQMVDRIHRAVEIEEALQTTAEELSQAMRVPHVAIQLSLKAPMNE